MKRFLLAFFSGLSLIFPALAQHYRLHPDIPVDSSYSAQNEWKKHSKKYQAITLADVGNTEKLQINNDVVYAKYGKREMHLDLVRPKGVSKKVPVVVIVHAGGWRSGEKNMDRPMAYELSRNGFATVCVEYRLSMEARYPAAIQDVKAAIRWVRANAKTYGLNPDKVAIMGTSAGGQLASLIGSVNEPFAKYQNELYKKYSDRVQAVVDVDGVLAFLHPESSEGQDQPGKTSAATLWFGVSAKENSALWNEASALHRVNKHTAPFLFVNSAQARFHAGQNDMVNKLNQLRIYNEVHQIPDTPHTFWLFHPWLDTAMTYIVPFLNKTLK
ncbi:alpha/beta hydrolase [Parabacteroides sp. FAFU027]|uniref:alpha/beta hydrolase n=1 Tax=Parabacteroides sp. FAFU027 TaxID=2922715 RepID=UPI001FAFB2FC|nr:alpha/beta hydrolase [Parabacteroides sp. FAFU027]